MYNPNPGDKKALSEVHQCQNLPSIPTSAPDRYAPIRSRCNQLIHNCNIASHFSRQQKIDKERAKYLTKDGPGGILRHGPSTHGLSFSN